MTRFGFAAALFVVVASRLSAGTPTPSPAVPTEISEKASDQGGIPIQAISEEVHHFLSPMVLELSVDALFDTPKPVGSAWINDRTRQFVCRGVTIEKVSLSVQRQAKGYISVGVAMFVSNASGKDKRVTASFASPPGEKAQSTATGAFSTNVSPDEKGTLTGQVLLVPIEEWAREPHPKLRITVTVNDN